MLRRNFRCTKCRTDYTPFERTRIKDVKIDTVKWLVLVKMFDIGTSTRRTTVKSETSYLTVLRTIDCMRYIILKNLSKDGKTIVVMDQMEFEPMYDEEPLLTSFFL